MRGPHGPRAPALAHLSLPVGLIGLIVTQHLCSKKGIGLYVHVHGAETILFLPLDPVNLLCESKIKILLTLGRLQVRPTHTHTHRHRVFLRTCTDKRTGKGRQDTRDGQWAATRELLDVEDEEARRFACRGLHPAPRVGVCARACLRVCQRGVHEFTSHE